MQQVGRSFVLPFYSYASAAKMQAARVEAAAVQLVAVERAVVVAAGFVVASAPLMVVVAVVTAGFVVGSAPLVVVVAVVTAGFVVAPVPLVIVVAGFVVAPAPLVVAVHSGSLLQWDFSARRLNPEVWPMAALLQSLNLPASSNMPTILVMAAVFHSPIG